MRESRFADTSRVPDAQPISLGGRNAASVKLGLTPRTLRVEYPDAIYHVINRGDRREDVFQNDNDWRLFLETLGQAFEKLVERG